MNGNQFKGRPGRTYGFGMVIAFLLVCGCGKKDSNDLISLKGRIEKAKKTSETTGEITVRFFSDKQNQEIVGTALVTPQTRIEKGGAAATFQDLQEGIQVQGQVRIDKEGGQRRFTAVHIKIENPPTSVGG